MTQTEAETQAHTLGKRVVRGTRVGVVDHRDDVLIMTAKAFSGTGGSQAEQEANARRIAACENACEGIPTEALETGVVADLLEACEAVAGHLPGTWWPGRQIYLSKAECQAINDAIAKVNRSRGET